MKGINVLQEHFRSPYISVNLSKALLAEEARCCRFVSFGLWHRFRIYVEERN